MDGKNIEHVTDLKSNGYYVAVGPYEKFRHVEYTLEGRPNMFVPIKRSGKNPYEITQVEQPGVERKRRRTFVVRLKKNASITDDEDEQDLEDHHTRQRHSTERHHQDHDEKKRHHSKESRHRHHHREDDVITQRESVIAPDDEDTDQSRHGLYARGRADLNKSAHSVMLREAINKSRSQLVVGSAKSQHEHDVTTLGPSRSQSLPGAHSHRNLGDEQKKKLGLPAGSNANLTPGSTLNTSTSQATLQPSTSKLSARSHMSHKSRSGSNANLGDQQESRAEIDKSHHSRVFDSHSQHQNSHRDGGKEDDESHHISHRIIPSYIDDEGQHHEAEDKDAHSGQTAAVGDHYDQEIPDHTAAGKSHCLEELHSHITTVGPDGELIYTERHDTTENDKGNLM